MKRDDETFTCSCCGRAFHWMDEFPNSKCVECHAADPKVQRELASMTADDLARVWGATGRDHA